MPFDAAGSALLEPARECCLKGMFACLKLPVRECQFSSGIIPTTSSRGFQTYNLVTKCSKGTKASLNWEEVITEFC